MSAGTPDPHIVELGTLMLARAPKLGEAMADLLCREIDAYRDGTTVAKEEVRESCVANLTFIFDSLAGHADPDVSPAEQTGAAAGLLRTFMYLGAIASAGLIGLAYGHRATDAGLHRLAAVLTVVALALLAVTAVDRTLAKNVT